MKKATLHFCYSLFILLLMVSCGNSKQENEQKPETQAQAKQATVGRPAIHFVLDGREISSSDYSCSWVMIGKTNTFNLTVFYDRDAGGTPPRAGFNIYNLTDIKAPINRLNGQLPGKSTAQLFSLSANTGTPKGKPADLDKTSFTDNYTDLQSTVQLTNLDTVAKTCTGLFEGTLKNAQGDILKITNGSFEGVSYKTGY